jgi:serine/threonine protein kinase
LTDFTTSLQSALSPDYTLERELTGGGMSRVFVATDTSLGRKVVVKVLPPELAAGVNHERFRREIQIAAQLQHPHIVPLLSAGEQMTLIWYTMPFIQGHSLREALSRGDKFSVRDAVRILHEVAEALDYAHGLGVIHRDIKPGNVLLLGTHALVTDFGVSKAISAAMPQSGYTSAGMAIGTPAYMAPEQIAADPSADHRMDLYALGLLAYEILTGDVPFKEASPQQTMAAQLTRDPVPVESIRGDVPPALAALIKRLLAKLPDDRPATAAEVVLQLDDISVSSGPSFAPIRRTTRPSRMRAAALALASVGIVATAWVLGQKSGGELTAEVLRDSIAAAESLQAVAPMAAILTREDSIAIARAVASRVRERPAPSSSGRPGSAASPTSPTSPTSSTSPAAPASPTAPTALTDVAAMTAFADSIRLQVQRIVLDSLLLLQTRTAAMPVAMIGASGAPTASASPSTSPARPVGPRRVVIAAPRGSRNRPDLDAIATTLADSLWRALDAHPDYIAVPADSAAAVLRESRTVNTVQERLDASLIVSISLVPARDSVVRLVQLRDLSARTGFGLRVVTHTAPIADPTAGVGKLVAETLQGLAEMERAQRFVRGTREAPEPPRPPRTPVRP